MRAEDIVRVGDHYYLLDRTSVAVASTDASTGLPAMPEDFDLYIDSENMKAATIVGMIHSGIDQYKKRESKKNKMQFKKLHKFYKNKNKNKWKKIWTNT